jgi:hypothetical protein
VAGRAKPISWFNQMFMPFQNFLLLTADFLTLYCKTFYLVNSKLVNSKLACLPLSDSFDLRQIFEAKTGRVPI